MKNKNVLIPQTNRQGGERLMTYQELKADTTNGLKLMMVSIIFILQRPELLFYLCAQPQKKTLEKFVGNITPSVTVKEVIFPTFCSFSMKKIRNGQYHW